MSLHWVASQFSKRSSRKIDITLRSTRDLKMPVSCNLANICSSIFQPDCHGKKMRSFGFEFSRTSSLHNGGKQGIDQQNQKISNFFKFWNVLFAAKYYRFLSSTCGATYMSFHINIVDMCKFESSQKDESKAQPADSSKAYSKPRAFNCRIFQPTCFWTVVPVISQAPKSHSANQRPRFAKLFFCLCACEIWKCRFPLALRFFFETERLRARDASIDKQVRFVWVNFPFARNAGDAALVRAAVFTAFQVSGSPLLLGLGQYRKSKALLVRTGTCYLEHALIFEK